MSKSHGMTNTQTHHSWRGMIERCRNRNQRSYAAYGGRGIAVCERWKSFENFISDMGERPPSKTLDRINNDGNYEPDNCRWATRKEQNTNRSYSVMLTLNGETMCMTEWAKRLGIGVPALHCRLNVYGWSVERALSTAKLR